MKWFLFFTFGMLLGAASHAETIPAPYSLTAQTVEAAVAGALQGQDVGKQLAVTITGTKQELYKSGVPVSARISQLSADKAKNRWQANLLIVSEQGAVLSAQPIAGRYQEMVTIPVVKRALRIGDIIAQDDLDSISFPLARTRSDVVTDATQLIGQAARNAISPHRPIRATELAAPSVLKKNAFVQMAYRNGALEIFTSGQALSAGAKGDVIQVRNLSSQTVVRAVVENENTVIAVPIGVNHAQN